MRPAGDFFFIQLSNTREFGNSRSLKFHIIKKRKVNNTIMSKGVL